LPCPEGARAAPRRCEAEGPGSTLLGRADPPRARKALAARSRREPGATARHDQAPGLPGEHGGRPALGGQPTTTEKGACTCGRPFFWS
jgi:hypothetical protein